jgi:hypothetical protein
MAQIISRRPLTAEAPIRARFNPCVICGRQSGTGAGFSPSSSGFPCQYISFHRRSPIPVVEKAGWAPEPFWTPRLEEKCLVSAGDRTSIARLSTEEDEVSVIRHLAVDAAH